MSKQPPKQLYKVPLEYKDGSVRTIPIRASTQEVAERRALKFNPAAVGVKR